MGHLYRFNLKKWLRSREEMFWPLLFPIILGTLFALSFGVREEDSPVASAIPVALVRQGETVFESFLNGMDGGMLEVEEMEAEEAEEALAEGRVEGVFYSGESPSLTVAASQLSESVLEVLLDTYLQNRRMLTEIGEERPLKLLAAVGELKDYQSYVEQVNIAGNEANSNLNYFFALIAMACLFGAFMGMTSALELRADQSALAARRSVVPTGRLSLVVSEMLAAFTVQFFNSCALLAYLRFALGISFGERWALLLPVCFLGSLAGVAYGIFIGSLRLKEGFKVGVIVGSTLFMSFLAGLMFGNMKNVVEHYCPLVNRVNPAALISDAFYSISVYENMERYLRNLLTLAVMTAVLTAVSYFRLRRERYDSL